MGLGFSANSTNITAIENNLFSVANSTDVPSFLVNVNHFLYDGWLFVVLLFVTWIILFMISQKNDDANFLNNLMNTSALVSVLSLFMRGIYVYVSGPLKAGLLTDSQLWIFPLITIVLVLINYSNK
jgi:hypothetical protein